MKKNKTRDDLYMEDVPQNTKATVRRLLSRLGRQKGRLLVVTAATLLSSAAYAAIPLLVGMALDNLLAVLRGGASAEQKLSLAAGALFLPVLLLLAASAASSLLAYVQQYVIASVGEELTLSLRQDISRKLGRLPLRYFDSHKTGDILSRITNDLEKVSSVMQVGLMQLISSAFTILLTCVIMLILSPLLFLVTLVSVLVCAVATKYVSRWSQRCYAENMAAMGALSAKVEELYAGNRVIKVFSRQEEAVGEVSALNQAQFEANRRAQFADFAIYPSIRLLNQLGFVAVAVAGGLSALAGGMTLGGVQAFLQYVNQISEPVTQASYVITSLQAAIAGAERVFALLDEEEERPDSAGLPAPLAEGRVAFRGVRFGYTPDRLLMRDVNLEVRPGDMVAIVGPTGGGKTTLINLLMRFYELNGGVIEVDGQDISALPRAALRRHIGMVLQDTWLFEGTVAENIAYGRPGATRTEIEEAARLAGADAFVRALKDGYDTYVGERGVKLSGGQKQRLAIARVFLKNPRILLLDEATSALDNESEILVGQSLDKLAKGRTTLTIAHRLTTIKNADRILVLGRDGIEEEGSHDELLAKQGVYYRLWNGLVSGETL